jgi:hypothetical protein
MVLNQNGGTRADNKREIDINFTHGQSRRDTADGVGDNAPVKSVVPPTIFASPFGAYTKPWTSVLAVLKLMLPFFE